MSNKILTPDKVHVMNHEDLNADCVDFDDYKNLYSHYERLLRVKDAAMDVISLVTKDKLTPAFITELTQQLTRLELALRAYEQEGE